MKKLFLFILALLPMMVFTSCSSDDKADPISLLSGTWTTVGEGFIDEITFKSNHQITSVTTFDNGEKEENVGTYTVDSELLTINWMMSRTYNPITQTWTAYKEKTRMHTYTYTIQGKRIFAMELGYGANGTPFFLLKTE